ncbi:MAG: hypothetical protein AABY13_05540 [Nanoarchaeota archaeon]
MVEAHRMYMNRFDQTTCADEHLNVRFPGSVAFKRPKLATIGYDGGFASAYVSAIESTGPVFFDVQLTFDQHLRSPKGDYLLTTLGDVQHTMKRALQDAKMYSRAASERVYSLRQWLTKRATANAGTLVMLQGREQPALFFQPFTPDNVTVHNPQYRATAARGRLECKTEDGWKKVDTITVPLDHVPKKVYEHHMMHNFLTRPRRITSQNTTIKTPFAQFAQDGQITEGADLILTVRGEEGLPLHEYTGRRCPPKIIVDTQGTYTYLGTLPAPFSKGVGQRTNLSLDDCFPESIDADWNGAQDLILVGNGADEE